jgi:hypothetical protein
MAGVLRRANPITAAPIAAINRSLMLMSLSKNVPVLLDQTGERPASGTSRVANAAPDAGPRRVARTRHIRLHAVNRR